MQYWLFKSEPDTFSFEDLQRLGTSPWDGVRNYQARNYLRTMKPGDLGFFYHSRVSPPGVVGICKVVSEPRPDLSALDPACKYYDPKATQEDPRWTLVEVAYQEPLARFVTLEELKTHKSLHQMVVARKGSRLSITPVTAQEWKALLKLSLTT
jgi:predicted RNA-binding protein with PUA-like domain